MFILFCTRLLPVSVFNYLSVDATIMYHILCTLYSIILTTEILPDVLNWQVYYDDALVHVGLA